MKIKGGGDVKPQNTSCYANTFRSITLCWPLLNKTEHKTPLKMKNKPPKTQFITFSHKIRW